MDYHIEAENDLAAILQTSFYVHFLVWKLFYFYSNFTGLFPMTLLLYLNARLFHNFWQI